MLLIYLLICIILGVDHVTCLSKKKLELQKKLFFKKLTSSFGNDDVSKNCSIERSAFIHRQLNKDFYPLFSSYGVDIPLKCPFHIQRNVFAEFEKFKSEVTSTIWQCGICGKKFYLESYLHNHMWRKHASYLKKSKENVCLAGYCDIFRCHIHEQYPQFERQVKCNAKRIREIQRKCENAIRACLPQEERYRLYDNLYGRLCSSLTCESYFLPFEDMSLVWVVCLSIGIPLTGVVLIHLIVYWDVRQFDDPDGDYKRSLRRVDTSVISNSNRKYFYDKPPITRRR